MGEIIIGNAPVNYRKYLWATEANDGPLGYDCKTDTQEEAENAAEAFCGENPTECENFLEYLEKSGNFNLSQLRETLENDKKVSKEVASLMPKLGSKYYNDVRNKAVKALGQIAHFNISIKLRSKIVDAIIPLLGDEDMFVRESAAEMLRAIAKCNISLELRSKIANALIPSVHDEFHRVRNSAVNTLVNIVQLNSSLELSLKIVDGMAAIIKFNGPDWDGQSSAAKMLEKTAQYNVSPELNIKIADVFIQSVVNSEVPDVLESAVRALGKIVQINISNELNTKIVNALKSVGNKYGRVEELALKTLGEIARLDITKNITQELRLEIINHLIIKANTAVDQVVRKAALTELKEIVKLNVPAEIKSKIEKALKN